MANLLRAGLLRLRKSRIFWSCLFLSVIMKTIAALSAYQFMISKRELWPVDRIQFLDMPAFVMICGLFCGLFVGTEYRNGGIGGRIMSGSSRRRVYLADFILCALACGLFWLSGMAAARLLGLPFFGKSALSGEQELACFIGGMFMTAALTGIFYFLAIILQSRIWGTAVCLLTGTALLSGIYFLKKAGSCSGPELNGQMGLFCIGAGAVILFTNMAGIYIFWRKDIK